MFLRLTSLRNRTWVCVLATTRRAFYAGAITISKHPNIRCPSQSCDLSTTTRRESYSILIDVIPADVLLGYALYTFCYCCCFHELLYRTLVPARTVVGVRPATATEVTAAGVQGNRGGGASGGSTLVMEFSSALNARLVRVFFLFFLRYKSTWSF